MELMGLATIGALICHAVGNHVSLPESIRILFCFGQTGNSLFMLLSGFGLFYSLRKYETSGDSILKWYKKRYARILIPYILWYVVHLVRAYNTPDTDWLQFLYGFSLIKYWTHDSGAWFLSVLVPLYALSTAFMKILSWGAFLPEYNCCTLLYFGCNLPS